MSKSTWIKLAVALFGLALFVGAAYLLDDRSVPIPDAGDVVVRGNMTCLPHKDTTGPQTLECALGFQDESGHYYALHDTDPSYKNVSGAPGDAVLEVTGRFIPQDDEKYDIIGLIEVTKIALPYVPSRATIKGEYVCLPYKDSAMPNDGDCKAGLLTEDGTYYALDFAMASQTVPTLSVGDRFSADGLVVLLEELSTDMWNVYPIRGIFSVTDSFKRI